MAVRVAVARFLAVILLILGSYVCYGALPHLPIAVQAVLLSGEKSWIGIGFSILLRFVFNAGLIASGIGIFREKIWAYHLAFWITLINLINELHGLWFILPRIFNGTVETNTISPYLVPSIFYVVVLSAIVLVKPKIKSKAEFQ